MANRFATGLFAGILTVAGLSGAAAQGRAPSLPVATDIRIAGDGNIQVRIVEAVMEGTKSSHRMPLNGTRFPPRDSAISRVYVGNEIFYKN